MKVLRISIPKHPNLSLRASDDSDAATANIPGRTGTVCNFDVPDAQLLSIGKHAVVYRGIMYDDGKRVDEVALKFILGKCANDLEQLDHEFKCYKSMEPIQGDVVPKCYGLFKASDKFVACLVLQFCGNPYYVDHEELGMDLRVAVVENLMAIHACNLQHNNFEPENIVFDDDDKPYVVDFRHATDHYCECDLEGVPIEEGACAPDEIEFGCSEIYRYTYDNGIWRPGFFCVLNIYVPELCATSVEAIEDYALKHNVTFGRSKELRRHAENYMKLMQVIDKFGGCMPREDVLRRNGVFLPEY